MPRRTWAHVIGILLAATVAVFGIAEVIVVVDEHRKTCVKYDVLAEEFCGTPQMVEVQFEARGIWWVQQLQEMEESPVPYCIERSHAQAAMHGWPHRYQMAFEEGCREGWNR